MSAKFTAIAGAGLLAAASSLWAAGNEPQAEVGVTTPAETPGAKAQSGVSPAVLPTASERGREFITNAAKGNMGEIRLGELAQKQAESDAVRAFAEKLVDDHRAANEALIPVAQANDVAWPTDLTEEHKQLVERLSALSVGEFDEPFMRAMLEEHEKDVQTYEEMAAQGENPELSKYVHDTLPVLKEHLERARELAGGASSQD